MIHLDWLTSQPAFLEDEPVRLTLLARLGREDERARALVEPELTEEEAPS